MRRQAFQRMGPFQFGPCGIALLLGFLLVQSAICNPMDTAGTKPLDLPDETLSRTWTGAAAYGDEQEHPLPSESALYSFSRVVPKEADGNSFLDSWSRQNLGNNAVGIQESADNERYPYLLLTAGLILLAFRPANQSSARRR